MGRTATFPYGEHHRTPRQRERTAVAFAAIQLLATCDDPNLFHVWSLCSEFRDRVLGVADAEGRPVAPDFTRTEAMLGLPPGSVRMDNSLPVVQEHKLAFPGYFIDNDDAARLLAFLLDGGQIAVSDLADGIRRVTDEEPDLEPVLAAADHRTLAEVLTRPRRFKHLAPRIASDQPFARMSAAEFRACLLHGTGDGPFSATVLPQAWAASARAVLVAAEEKYAATRRAARQPEAAWERRYSSTMTSVSSSSEVSDARLSKEIVPWRSRLMRSATSST
jgi:hypothetical protein